MKKRPIGIDLLLIAVLCVASCDKDEPQIQVDQPVEEGTGPGTVYATIENPVELSANEDAGAGVGGASDVRIALTSSYSGNLHLSLRKDDLAWKSESDYVLVRAGSTKTLAIKHLDGGVWYVGVYCPDKPKSTLSSGHYKYSSNTTVLNGAPYSLQATWN